jgi:4'-phosphopantetheinyl transferase
LRVLLSLVTGRPPSGLRFTYSPHGKPSLEGSFSFNASHARDYAVYAMTSGADVGVDVEAVDRSVDRAALADRFFAPREAEQLRSLRDERHLCAFFDCWTRKEAFIKALGEGLSVPLDAFEVSLASDAACVVAVSPELSDAAEWTMASFTPAEGYTGAVAVRCRDVRFSFLDLDPRSVEDATTGRS